MPSDFAVLIVYPDYPIDTDSFYGYTEMVGHAGVLLIQSDGLSKYYEFGRYRSKRGNTVKRTIPDARMENGKPTENSMKRILKSLSIKAGKKTRIRGAIFINMDFDKMLKRAKRKRPALPLYDIISFNCGHFAEDVILQGHPDVDQPMVINPTPNNIVDEYIEEGNAEIKYNLETDDITIGIGDETDAKDTNWWR